MRPLDRLLLILDRTLVLFIGLAVGAVVTFSIFAGGQPATSQAEASVPALPRAAAPSRRATAPMGPTLAMVVAQRRRIEMGVFGDSFGDGVWAGLYNRLRGH